MIGQNRIKRIITMPSHSHPIGKSDYHTKEFYINSPFITPKMLENNLVIISCDAISSTKLSFFSCNKKMYVCMYLFFALFSLEQNT